jgi:hypothetical protein
LDDLSGSGGSGSGGDETHTHARATQTAYTRAAFEAYFWAADVIVAIGQTDGDAAVGGSDDGQVQAQFQNVASGNGDLLENSRGGRSWEDALVGFYYVKPNYPGRSSHVSVFLSPLPLLVLFYTRRNRSLTHNGLFG